MLFFGKFMSKGEVIGRIYFFVEAGVLLLRWFLVLV